MTTDRDRVEAALSAYYCADTDDDSEWADDERDRMSRALAAAGALAPPPVPLDREAVAEAIDPDKGHAGAAFAAADRVLALLPAAPLAVPEEVQRLLADIERMSSVGYLSGEHGDWRGLFAGICHKARAVRAILVTPAPPADTGDGRRWRVGRRVPVNVYRDDVVAAQFQREEWAAEAVSALNRVRELEAEIERLTRERDEARAWIAEATREITGLSGGGSENFVRVGEQYRADLPFCGRRIRERFEGPRKILTDLKARAEAAEKERDEARSRVDEYAREIFRANRAQDAAEARLARARADALEEAAKLVETQQERITETDDGTVRSLSPRMHGNLAGLAFATGIRALAGSEPAGRAEQEADNA